MFDFLRNITKPAEEKRQERLNAYLDDALSVEERRRFEQELEHDAELRAELEQLRWVKLSIQQVPRVRAPRNFVLDPAVFGQRARRRQPAAPGFYPGLRVATALTAFFFILTLALDLATPYGALNQPLLGSGASQVAMEESSRQADDVAMVTEAEMESAAAADEAPVDGEVPAEEPAAEVAPFATTGEPDVGEVAEEAAEEGAVPEALDAEQPAEEEAMVEEQPEAEESTMPAVGGAVSTDERTAAPTETAGASAFAPQGTPGPPTEMAEEAEEMDATRMVSEAQETTPAEMEIDAVEERVVERSAASFPYLLVVEIILGAALAGLVVVMMISRRGG